MGKLDGKTALITGGTSGIGLATAKRFVNEDAYVFITGRRDPELAAAVKEIREKCHRRTRGRGQPGNLDCLFAQIKREKGKLDVVFANAGVGNIATFGEISEELLDSIFTINVKGLPVHGPEGASAAAGRCLHHPECVHRRQERVALE